MKIFFPVFTAITLFFASCSSSENSNANQEVVHVEVNPAAEGFNVEESDVIAIALADSVMLAMGGREAWDNTRFFEWNFFGARKHWWDKQTGNVRIESQRTDLKVAMNIFNQTGKVFFEGQELSNPDSLKKYLDVGNEMWINDSYWLVMPFKLKDSGVTLNYIGADTMQNGQMAEILQMTFKEVGVTPENKYWVYINPSNYLIEQWAYFDNYQDSLPRFTTPWIGYEKHGQILLSGDRGVRQITDIATPSLIPDSIFSEL